MVPAVWVKPRELELLKAVDGLNPGGTISSELVMLTRVEPTFCNVPVERSRMQLEPLSTAGLLPPSKIPELTRPPLIWSVPPLELIAAAAADGEVRDRVRAAGLLEKRRGG